MRIKAYRSEAAMRSSGLIYVMTVALSPLSQLTRRGVISIINDSIRHQAESHHRSHLQGKLSEIGFSQLWNIKH